MEVDDIPALPNTEFLSAKELVSLRKPAEETAQPVIGEKIYTCSDLWLEDKALKCALENYKDILDKKRAGKICDLMQAEWNPESNTVTVSKLKGKFTQHMGRLVNGKHVLAPVEAIFLLENNCIEIMHGSIPMSTEEAFSLILKGNLAAEKYEVYSHLSKLGYVVVLHQAETGITEYEKEMNLDKCPLKRKHQKDSPESEPEKKRLTFSGALSEESDGKITSETSTENSAVITESEINLVYPDTSLEETGISKGSENIVEKNFGNVTNLYPETEEQKNGEFIHKVGEDTQYDIDKYKELIHKVSEDIQYDIDKNKEASMSNAVLETRFENKNSETSKEINSICDSKLVEENGTTTEKRENTKSNGVDSQNCNKLLEKSELQNDLSLRNNESHDFLDSNSQSSKFVDVMDVDTDAETSCSTSEVSRDNFNTFDSNVNVTSQDSCVSVNNEDNNLGNANPDSNFDVLSMSSSSLVDEEEEVLTIDAVSADNAPNEEDDDEVTLLEVTKKETKPLAVIDLLSDDDEEEEEEATETVDVDDEVTVLEEYSSPTIGGPSSSKEVNLNGCKKEEEEAVFSSSKLIPSLTVLFPDLFKKRVICVARPPSHLLPHHVKPSKEAYVLNLKPKNPERSTFNNRVWNSYRDMQDYQRQRRQNRHQNNISPYSGSQTWQDRNSRNYERSYRPGFGPDRENSPDVNSTSRRLISPHPMDFNRNLFSVNSFQNNLPLPNPTAMNCEMTIKEDTSESMVSSTSQSSHSNNFSFPPSIPNNPLMNSMIPVNPNNFMAGIQRNAFSMGNVPHTHLMAELQRTCFTVATNVLSNIFNRNTTPFMSNPPLHMFPPHHLTPSLSNGFNNSPNVPGGNDYFSMPHHIFNDQQHRFPRGRPFPCRYRNVSNKRSWSEVRSAVCHSSSDDSDIEIMPINPSEILWNNKDICPLVKPGIYYSVGSVLKFLQITQKAKVTHKYGYSEKLLSNDSRLEISFDVYPPGFTYKKTCPQIPKYRILVVKSTDPFPKYSDFAVLQRKWNDGATLMIAVNDNGDISFQSFNSISLPLLSSHED